MKTLYTAHVTSIGGREGKVTSDDGVLSLQLAKPGAKTGSNPEQLFAAGYSACFLSATAHIAKMQNKNADGLRVQADVSLNEDNGFFLGVTLSVSLPNLDKAAAEQLVNEAHHMCPYSKATQGNIDVQLKVNDQLLSRAA
jgi:osmotically inducible protein OsmC